MPSEEPEISRDLDTTLPVMQETQNQHTFEINPEQVISSQKVIDAGLPQISSGGETTDDDTYISPRPFVSSRMRTRLYVNRPQQAMSELPNKGLESSEEDTSELTDEDMDVNEPDGNFAEIFEDYSSPNFDPYDISGEESSTGDSFSWILLWIMKFRIKFNIPETATESLIKFMKLVLNEIGGDNFNTFPKSLYLAKKALGLNDRFQSFVPCTKCHKLYKKQEVENFRQDETPMIMKCQHIEFPNSTICKTKKCETSLSRKVGDVFRPELIYPFVGIQQQLSSMYCRPGFEVLLRHWSNRQQFDNISTDIYNGQVWRSFKDTNTSEGSQIFFRPDVADSHLGLMMNINWFQPFDGTTHSTGVIYAVICNLPRDIRFKRKNMLIFGILPGPYEVSLHKINHYLAPIVDNLELLWRGVTLTRTFERKEGRNIHAALILVLCDIPAARKICGHILALVSCHRCEEKANYEDGKHNFADMDDMNEWFIPRDLAQHRENALGWRRCNSEASRQQFVKLTGVRWSELLRLPYFNPEQ